MGWHSKHIMGGDPPSDSMSMFFDMFGVEQYPEEGEPGVLTKELVEEKQAEIFNKLKKKKGKNAPTIIDLQVFGVIILNSGAKFLPEVKEKVIQCLREDEWAAENLERKIYVEDMIEIIETYDATENPGSTKEYKEYENIPYQHWLVPRLSSEILKLAMDKFTKYCSPYPIIKKISASYQKYNGYSLLLLVDDSDETALQTFLNNEEFEWTGVYDIPVQMIFTSDFGSVEISN
jgi:hypothetical protein